MLCYYKYNFFYVQRVRVDSVVVKNCVIRFAGIYTGIDKDR